MFIDFFLIFLMKLWKGKKITRPGVFTRSCDFFDFYISYRRYTISISCTVTFFSASTPNAFNTGFPGSIKDKIRYSAVES